MKKILINNVFVLCLYLLLANAFYSCSGKKDSLDDSHDLIAYSALEKQYSMPLMEWNKDVVEFNRDLIIKYAERRKWEVNETETGLFYNIYYKGSGTKAESGKLVEFAYTIWLMDGTLLYTSDSLGNREMLLGHNDEESGVDEALKKMCVGDKAHLIIPPHLAFGVPGDGGAIPPRSILVYDVELISLKN